MAEIFISYLREDIEAAEKLAEALEAHGWSVFLDRRIPAGKRFDDFLVNQLQAARCIVVLWSHQSIRSTWVRDEAAVGRDRGILVPARLDDVSAPFGFSAIQAADLIGWQGDPSQRGFQQLLGDIRAAIEVPARAALPGMGEPSPRVSHQEVAKTETRQAAEEQQRETQRQREQYEAEAGDKFVPILRDQDAEKTGQGQSDGVNVVGTVGSVSGDNPCYIDQFTARESPPHSSHVPHISIFGNSRALQGNKEIWSHTETLTQQAIFRWFDVDALKEYIELDELSQQWSTLFDKKVHVWEGIRGIVKVENHPYIKEMYPFILVGQTDKDKLWVNDDSRMYIILLFCAWAYKLCSPSKSLRSETTTFSIKNFTVTSSYVHLHGSFSFKDIKVTSLKKEFTKTKHEYKLDRHIFAAYSGSKICTVMTGVPHPADAESEYIKHVREWLNEFRLGRS